MIFSVAPAIAPLIGGWIHVAFGWRAVFGFLALLGVAVVFASWVKLPETLPPQRRTPAGFGALAALSWRIMRTREFVMLALAGGLNFGAVLAFVGSAPAIVLDNWKLGETQFHWLFIPIIGGFTIGALLSGRMAGRLSQSRQVALGFATTIGASALAATLHATLASPPPILVQQLLMTTSSIGVQLVFPVLTLRVLDMFPATRGSAASVQTFIQLLVASTVIGVLVPMIHGALLWLTFGSMVAALGSWLLWNGAARLARQRAPAPT
jgi:DHA1 family bicyclomycin/chloramphenicol resistance-like MFS transporter